jgi:hypothetical protein
VTADRLVAVVAETMADSFGGVPADVYTETARDVLAALALPANRDALVAGLVETGVLVDTGVWLDPHADIVWWPHEDHPNGAVPLLRIGGDRG